MIIETEVWANGRLYGAELDLAGGKVIVLSNEDRWEGVWSDKNGAHTFVPYFDLQIAAAVTDAIKNEDSFKSWLDADPKVRALALEIDESVEDITESSYGDFEVDLGYGHSSGRVYAVLTDEEADEKAKERAKDTLWAFNEEFLARYIPALRHPRAAQAWSKVAMDLCEDANPLVEAMLGINITEFLNAAISADGRGHFIDNHDGDERECRDPITTQIFYVYRMN